MLAKVHSALDLGVLVVVAVPVEQLGIELEHLACVVIGLIDSLVLGCLLAFLSTELAREAGLVHAVFGIVDSTFDVKSVGGLGVGGIGTGLELLLMLVTLCIKLKSLAGRVSDVGGVVRAIGNSAKDVRWDEAAGVVVVSGLVDQGVEGCL